MRESLGSPSFLLGFENAAKVDQTLGTSVSLRIDNKNLNRYNEIVCEICLTIPGWAELSLV